MRRPLGTPTRNRRLSNKFQYESLEDRRVLAVLVSFDAGTGHLNVELTDNNDTAVVDIASGNVTVNGSEDLDSATPGTQSIPFPALRSITIDGDNTKANQQATFNGDYSNANGAALQSMSVEDVRFATINGNYQLAGNFFANLVNGDGQISDGTTGQLRVGGTTAIDANNNEIILDNAINDFVGDFAATNAGTGRDMTVADANNLQFALIVSSGDLIATAVGDITDTAGASIIVAADGRFEAANVVLGDNAGDVTRFERFDSDTLGGTTELNQDSNVILLNIDADDLTVRSSAGIFDGRTTEILVANQATFVAVNRIRIGDNGTDTFNAGRLSFQTGGYVSIFENSGTLLTDVSFASALNMVSEGSITDDATSSLNVTNDTGFEAENVILGDTATDQFNTGSMYFYTSGDFFVSEDSEIHIIETKNAADRLVLNSPLSITDANDASISVTRLARFTSNSVNIGDTATDFFEAGSILFDTTAQFKLTEDNNTNIVGFNNANAAIIESSGDITDVFAAGGGEGARIDVAAVAEFTGANITLGVETNGDQMNFGALRLNSPGTATVTESSATNFAFSNSVAQLNLVSLGAVRDATDASLNVGGVADIQGTSISLGDTATDEFNANSVTLNSTGAVAVTEDSALNLHKTSTADSMTLTANGTLTDGLDADTQVTNLFSVVGNLINLGSEATDNLEFGSLTFFSTANTNISSDSNMTLTGINTVGDQAFLATTGNLTDEPTAETRIQNQASLTGVDVIIGELADDCFDIINGDESDLFVTASGINDVTLGCP
jgi:hypothetical protein